MPTLTDLKVDYVSLVDRAASRDPVNQSEAQRFLVWKRDSADPTHEGEGMTEEEKAALAKAQADLTAALATIETQKADNATLATEVAALKKAAEPAVKADEDKVDLSKADPALRARLEKAEADAKANAERLEKAEETIKAERDERLKATFIAKAETYKALPVKATEFGPVLKSASEKLTKDEYDALEQVLKAADEQIVAGDLFKEQGRSGDAAAKADGALAEVNKRAEEIRKADPKISLAKAQDMAITADPALQARYLAETR